MASGRVPLIGKPICPQQFPAHAVSTDVGEPRQTALVIVRRTTMKDGSSTSGDSHGMNAATAPAGTNSVRLSSVVISTCARSAHDRAGSHQQQPSTISLRKPMGVPMTQTTSKVCAGLAIGRKQAVNGSNDNRYHQAGRAG